MCCYRSLDKAKGDRDDDNHVDAVAAADDDLDLNDYDDNDDDENIDDDFSQPRLAPNGSCLLL